MADSSEKVSFCVDMQCSFLRAEAFLVFDKGSQPTLGQQITDLRPTVGQQTADSWPTVGRLLANSFLGELFFIFSLRLVSNSSNEMSSPSFMSFKCLTDVFPIIFTFSNLSFTHSYQSQGDIKS